MKSKDEVMEAAYAAYVAAGKKAAIEQGTGTGKSRLGIETKVRENIRDGVLLLSNSERLRDIEWEKEFKKWGYEDHYPDCERECYQTAYKWKGRHFKLVIAEEVIVGFVLSSITIVLSVSVLPLLHVSHCIYPVSICCIRFVITYGCCFSFPRHSHCK